MAIPFPDNFFPYHSWGPRLLTGERDELCVRAIYVDGMEKLLFVSVENGDIDPKWVTMLSEVSGIEERNIQISATHTHTAPYIGGYWPEAVEDVEKSARYTENAWNTVTEAVKRAMSSAEPAFLQYGSGNCYVNINRDVIVPGRDTGQTIRKTGQNFHGQSDKTVFTLCFTRQDGSPIAVLFNYGVHSAVLFAAKVKDNGQLSSGDLAGFAMNHVERKLGGAVALFTMAPAADQGSRYATSVIEMDPDEKSWRYDNSESWYLVAELLGRDLAEEVFSIWQKMKEPCGEARIRTAAETIYVPGKVKKDGPGIPWPKSPEEYEPAEEVPLPLSLIAINDLAIVGIGCETSSGNTSEIRRTLKENGFADAVIVTQCNGSSPYMSDPEGYQVATFSAMASHMMPGAVECMIDGIGTLAGRVTGRKDEEA